MLFSMNDIDFDANDRVVEKSIEDLNKAILRGDTISGKVWQLAYYRDIIEVVDTVEYPERASRWDYPVDVIFELEGTCFRFSYYRGLTECQENEFEDMVAIPVHKTTRIITVEEWVANEDN